MAESLHILLGTSACLQWLCHSGERTVARGPLVLNYFSEILRLGISCELSARQTIHMKCQAIFCLQNTHTQIKMLSAAFVISTLKIKTSQHIYAI